MSDINEPTRVLHEEPMAKHTSWRVGGPAELFFKPADDDELAAFLASLPQDMPVHWIGLGSNLLVRDGGVRGAVIATGGLRKRLERVDDLRVTAGAGLACMLLARQCVRWQLGPAAFFAGIPGTIGGALAMNAGAFGGETWNNVESVETIDRSGVRRTRTREEFSIGYRSVSRATSASVAASGSADEAVTHEAESAAHAGARASNAAEEWFLAATFRFEQDETLDMKAIRKMLEKRAESQPLGLPSCGSVFRNPKGAFAGGLIEQAGLKGFRVGGAMVSDKHANFIINTGAATADDIERLIETVRQRVKERSGIELELEARMIGERPRGQQ